LPPMRDLHMKTGGSGGGQVVRGGDHVSQARPSRS
jgi:hypothetical protein